MQLPILKYFHYQLQRMGMALKFKPVHGSYAGFNNTQTHSESDLFYYLAKGKRKFALAGNGKQNLALCFVYRQDKVNITEQQK